MCILASKRQSDRFAGPHSAISYKVPTQVKVVLLLAYTCDGGPVVQDEASSTSLQQARVVDKGRAACWMLISACCLMLPRCWLVTLGK